MKSKIRVYVENLFDGALKTEEVVELREEILANVIDKYDDLISEGKSENEAYTIAVSGIGDVNDLLRTMGSVEKNNDEQSDNNMKKAMVEEKKPKTYLLCLAVVIYILSIVPVVIGDEIIKSNKAENIGVCILLVMVAIATALVIAYNSSKPKQVEESVQEEEEKEEPIVKSINSIIWAVATTIYFIVSFLTMAWHITWLIFVIANAITEVIKAVFEYKKEQ